MSVDKYVEISEEYRSEGEKIPQQIKYEDLSALVYVYFFNLVI
jgi:hypothetical protein